MPLTIEAVYGIVAEDATIDEDVGLAVVGVLRGAEQACQRAQWTLGTRQQVTQWTLGTRPQVTQWTVGTRLQVTQSTSTCRVTSIVTIPQQKQTQKSRGGGQGVCAEKKITFIYNISFGD